MQEGHVLKFFYQSFLLTLGALTPAGTAYRQVPAANDTSTTEGNQNKEWGAARSGPNPGELDRRVQCHRPGQNALNSNTSGYCNTATGYEALRFNTTGDENTAAGYQSALFQHDRQRQHCLRCDALSV